MMAANKLPNAVGMKRDRLPIDCLGESERDLQFRGRRATLKRKIPGGRPPGISDFTPRSSDQGRKSLCIRTLTVQTFECGSMVFAEPKISGEPAGMAPVVVTEALFM